MPREELDDIALQAFFRDFHPGHASSAELRGEGGQVVDIFSAVFGAPLEVQTRNHSALGDYVLKDFELAVLGNVADGTQFQPKAPVGPVAAEALHRFHIRHAFEGLGNFISQDFFPQANYQAFHNPIENIALRERHFDIDLGEFRLAVRPKVFVPEAFHDLEIPVQARYHQQLFEQLRRLGQRIKMMRMNPAGNQVIPRPLGV